MCSCGHHHHLDKKTIEQAINKFVSGIGANFDIDEEYKKIQRKESNLSKSQRDVVKTLVEYKKQYEKEHKVE